MSEKPTPTKVTRRKERIPPSSEPVPARADIIFYFILSTLISYPLFLWIATPITNNYFLKPYEQFFAIIGIYVISDLIGGYVASFPVARIVEKSYDASYFIRWYTERQRNILRTFLNWVFSAIFYTTGVFYLTSMVVFGMVSWETISIIYIIIKPVSAGLSHVLSLYMMNLKADAKK